MMSKVYMESKRPRITQHNNEGEEQSQRTDSTRSQDLLDKAKSGQQKNSQTHSWSRMENS